MRNEYLYSPSFAYLHNIINVSSGLSIVFCRCYNQRCVRSKEKEVIHTRAAISADTNLEADIPKPVFRRVDSVSHIEVHLTCEVVVAANWNVKLLVSHVEDHAPINICITVICTHPLSVPLSICKMHKIIIVKILSEVVLAYIQLSTHLVGSRWVCWNL